MKRTNLPDFAFLHGYGENDELYNRNVILHIPSRSILEIYEEKDIEITENDLSFEFTINHNINGKSVRDKYVMVVHSSPFFSIKAEEDYIIKEIMLPAFRWFADFCDSMDEYIEKKYINL